MNNEIKQILAYQDVDLNYYKQEKEYKKNPEIIKYVQAMKKGQAWKELKASFDKNAELLLERFEKVTKQKNALLEEKTQLDKAVEDCQDLVGVEYIEKQIKALIKSLDEIKKTLEDLSKDMVQVNNDYITNYKEVAKAKEVVTALKEFYEKTTKEIKQKKEEVSNQLEKLASGISVEFLEKYKAKRADKDVKMPLVRGCDGKFCSHCFQELSMVEKGKISSDSLLECENCHKFIYLQD